MQLSGSFIQESDSDPFVVNRAKKLLQSQLEEKGIVRITYIALKQQLISEYGESEFGRNKCTIQKLLQRVICKEDPKVAKAFANKQKDVYGAPSGSHRVPIDSKPKSEIAKCPRLYFYKMNEEESGSAEGNRYISNDDL